MEFIPFYCIHKIASYYQNATYEQTALKHNIAKIAYLNIVKTLGVKKKGLACDMVSLSGVRLFMKDQQVL